MNSKMTIGLILIAGGVGYWLYTRNKSLQASQAAAQAPTDTTRLENWTECVDRLGILNGAYDCLFDSNKIRVSATGGPN